MMMMMIHQKDFVFLSSKWQNIKHMHADTQTQKGTKFNQFIVIRLKFCCY